MKLSPGLLSHTKRERRRYSRLRKSEPGLDVAVWPGFLFTLQLNVVWVEGDAHPIHFSPHDTTIAVDVAGLDHQRELSWNAHHAYDLKCGPRFGKVADSAVDARTSEHDCSCLQYPEPGNSPFVRHRVPSLKTRQRTRLESADDHHRLRFRDRCSRIEPLRAGMDAIHDRMTAIEAEWILKIVQTPASHLVAGDRPPAIGLQQHRQPPHA